MEQIKKSELAKQPEALYKDELQKVDKTKNQLNEIYLSLLQNPNQSIVAFLDILFHEIIANDTIPTSLLRVAIKTLTNVFQLIDCDVHLKNGNELYSPQALIKSLINC